MEYTKGEWEVIANGNSLLAIAALHEDVTQNRNICSFEPLFLRGEKQSVYRQLGSEDEANAHLIAAAPDLCEVLSTIQLQIDNGVLDIGDARVERDIRKALAKARVGS